MSNVQVGQQVTYVSARKGNRKFAVVTATPESLTEGTSLHIDEGHATLVVFSPTGSIAARKNVPSKDLLDTQAGEVEYDEEGNAIGGAEPQAYFEV